jgi:hypothetical protein
MLKFIFLFIPFIFGCSAVQYNYHPTSISYQYIRYGIKEQSFVLVLPIIQDNNKAVGSRTLLDVRLDIMTTSITNTENKKYNRYIVPNGFLLGIKYKY